MKFIQNYSKREIVFIIQREKVEHLDDLILRRSMLAMLGKISTQGLLELAEILGETLRWSDLQKNDEAERVIRLLENKHQIRL
ncbi:MAG: hypothetical protein UZ14_CFX002001184 [Chloroflexi bacterium OLB14]|nr:MAG: hypothetical protein UZ14_CFX002001184 [Chloroflexi bacterium OLB14]